jgi:hypothetical protein
VNYVDYNHVLDTSAAINGDVITSHTLVGYYSSKFPLKNGNCFSMRCNDGNVYRIVNFCYENLIEVTNRGVTLPIKVLPLNGRVAIICDSRIANDWYQDRFCECCCPQKHSESFMQKIKTALYYSHYTVLKSKSKIRIEDA